MSISILCPTRNRTNDFLRMYYSALEKSCQPDQIEFVICVDQDDIGSQQICGKNITSFISPPDHIYSNLHNLCASKAQHDILMGAADDIVFRTLGWDDLVRQEFEKLDDKIAYVYPNDGAHGVNLGTHGFFHKKWFETLGYLSPPIFTIDYSDNYVMDVARGVGRAIYLPNVLVEHMHWSFGKSEVDQTALEGCRRRQQTDNQRIFLESSQLIRTDITKLKKVMK